MKGKVGKAKKDEKRRKIERVKRKGEKLIMKEEKKYKWKHMEKERKAK